MGADSDQLDAKWVWRVGGTKRTKARHNARRTTAKA